MKQIEKENIKKIASWDKRMTSYPIDPIYVIWTRGASEIPSISFVLRDIMVDKEL